MNKRVFLSFFLVFSLSFVQAALPAPAPQKGWRGAASKADSSARMFKPVLCGSSIVCGNKTVQWDPDGKVRISNDGGLLFRTNLHFVYMRDLKHTDWYATTPSKCVVKTENGKIVWHLKKELDGKVYDAASQTLEITPEGLLKVHVKFHLIQAPGWVPRSKNGVVYFFVPESRSEGKDMIYSGKRIKLKKGSRTLFSDWRAKKFVFELYPDNDADKIGITALKPGVEVIAVYSPDEYNKAYFTRMELNKAGECTYLIDIRKGVAVKESPDRRGGIDFKAIENIELPDGSRRNLLQNSSFERGIEGFYSRHSGERYWEGKWQWKPFEVIKDASAPFGKHVLRFDAHKDLDGEYQQLRYGANITTQAIIVPEGKYTVSFYAKGAADANTPELRFWSPNFHSGSHYGAFSKEARRNFRLTKEWKRYSYSFTLPKAQPLEININAAVKGDKHGYIYLDALQLEKGTSASSYAEFPAEGRLLTSSPDNFVSADQKINGKLLITTAKAGMSGKAEIRVRNFFGEKLLKKQFTFKSGADKTAEILLPLDTLPGLGVFMLRADYSLADGTKAYEHHRYSKVKFLNNTHPNKSKIAFDYGKPEAHFQFFERLDRWKKVGVGGKHHHDSRDKRIWDAERKYGVEAFDCFLMSYLRDKKRKMIGFCIIDNIKTDAYINPDDPRILVRDFYFDSNGKITQEYLKKFQNAVKKLVAQSPHVPLWGLCGEIIAKFPVEWWSKEKTPDAAIKVLAQILKAFVAGVKEANPKAKVFQEDPCNMRPDGGIAETEMLLKECNKLGVRFDVICIHPYRFSPENPDLDGDAQTLFKMLDRVGYSNVPVLWPEMMHWGPFNIPQWGVVSSTWSGLPQTWPGILLSYDMGSTEKKSAAWYARSWLVVLKYGDRVLGATAGNTLNNCYMDLNMTPYAAQLAPNVLGHLLGDAKFRKDIRFAPFTRAYVFEDAQKRPVAAVWCHLDKVEDGYIDAPVAEADFGNTLESVTDFMNSPRAFTSGKYRFPVTSYPLFLRGKPGTLKQMTVALEGANIVSGQGVAPLELLANPNSLDSVRIDVKNFLSRPFRGTLNGKHFEVPASGKTGVILPVKQLKANALNRIHLPVVIKSDSGANFQYDLTFEAMTAKHVPDSATLKTIDWSKLPQIPLYQGKKAPHSGMFRIGWNVHGLFIETVVNDKKFIHNEYDNPEKRWCNDALQIYFDTMANARVRTFKGYDEDDYDYAVYPNSKGDKATVYRFRSVEAQLGLATQAPKDHTFAPDIPATFANKNGVQIYRVFFPAKYLLPVQLKPGWVLGCGLFVNNSDVPKKVSNFLTNTSDKGGCYNRPHVWPALLLIK